MNFMASFRSCGAFSFLPGADQGAGGLVNGGRLGKEKPVMLASFVAVSSMTNHQIRLNGDGKYWHHFRFLA